MTAPRVRSGLDRDLQLPFVIPLPDGLQFSPPTCLPHFVYKTRDGAGRSACVCSSPFSQVLPRKSFFKVPPKILPIRSISYRMVP